MAALSGVLLAAGAPPVNLYPLAWVGLAPLFLSLSELKSGGFGEGFTAGFVFNLAILYWIAFNTGTSLSLALLTMAVAVLVLAIGWGMAAWLFVMLRSRLGEIAWLLLPFGWTAWEGWLGHLGELAFPWPLLALTQAAFNPVLQVMEFTGVWGVTFWVAALNTAVFTVWWNKSLRVRLLAILVIVGLGITTILAARHAEGYYRPGLPTARVMVVQGNIPADEKWLRGISASWAVYDSLTRGGAYLQLDLVVWPETALPATLIQQSIYADKLSALADQTGAAIITGASDYCRVNGERKPLNACFLARPRDGIVARDAKRTLVPFGERVPFQWLFPQLGNLNFGQAEFRPGFSTPTNFEAAADNAVIRFPVMVCYESAFPKWSRLAAQSGANLLVTVSNDAWYGRSSEPAQIAALSRFRCIETRRAMARASNSGISFLCDQLGREIASTPLYQPAAIAAELPLVTAQTFYTRHGELFLAIATCVFGMGVLFAALTSRGRRKNDISSRTPSPLD